MIEIGMGRSANYACIDIGSNAIRFFVASLRGARAFALIDHRVSLRLGADTFSRGSIRRERIDELSEQIRDFRKVARKLNCVRLRAIATSAIRDAKNRDEVLFRIWKKSGVLIELIDGIEEARLAHLAVLSELKLAHEGALIMDIGGGSVELICSKNLKIRSAASLPLGTVRLLRLLGKEQSYSRYALTIRRELTKWLNQQNSLWPLIQQEVLVGTGGNVRCLARLAMRERFMGGHRRGFSKKPKTLRVTLDEVDHLTASLFSMSAERRARHFDLKPDRADVILPACVFVSEVMHALNYHQLYAPNIGIKNGLFWDMVGADKTPISSSALEPRPFAPDRQVSTKS